MAKEKLTPWEVMRKSFPSDQYTLLQEVRDKAGHYASRSADFITIGLWPSRGLHMNGYELKSSRSDWLNELKKPEKAENIFQYCDHFYLLTNGDGIAKPEEIPTTWGWVSIEKNRLVTKKPAPKLQPKPITNHFLAALMKRATDKTNYVHIDTIQDKLEEAKEIGARSATNDNNWKINAHDDMNRDIEEFKAVTGIDIRGSWKADAKEIGVIVNYLRDNPVSVVRGKLENQKKILSGLITNIEAGIEILDQHEIKQPSAPIPTAQ